METWSPTIQEAKATLPIFSQVVVFHIIRECSKVAHNAANQALQKNGALYAYCMRLLLEFYSRA
jgi:hypothetical protein